MKTPVGTKERIVNVRVESSEEDEDSETETSEEETSEEESSSEEISVNAESSSKKNQSQNNFLNSAVSPSENVVPSKISSDASTGSDPVPWRKPNLRRVGRQTSASRRASSDIPAWAEEAKKRLGDVPIQSQKPETPSSKPEWSDRRVDVDKLEEVERRHQERQASVAGSGQPEWARKKMDATTLGRLERANKLDKMASFDKKPSVNWTEKLQPPEQSKIRQLEDKDKHPDKMTSPDTGSSPWEVKLKPPTPAPVPPPPPPLPPPILSPMKPTKHGSSQLSEKQRSRLETLRKTSRRRPDWNELMVEITSPLKRLNKVQCNDRSAPIIKSVKRKDSAFVFESEKVTDADASSKLMNEIKSGIKLKRVKCNDRSRPNLQGLRKLRRQRTSEAFLNLPPEELIDSEPEELDDIDKLRDDLQSTRQLLGEEVKTCERLTKENKHLKNELKSLQEKLHALQTEQLKNLAESGVGKQNGETLTSDENQTGVLGRLSPADSSSSEWRLKFEAAEAELAILRSKVPNGTVQEVSPAEGGVSNTEVGLQRNKSLAKVAKSKTKEKIAKSSTKTNITNKSTIHFDQTGANLDTNDSANHGNGNLSENIDASAPKGPGETSDDETPSEGDKRRVLDDETKRKLRDLKMCNSRISHITTKEKHAKEEQINLKNRIKTLSMSIKDESRKYKELEREVHKLGSVMKGSDCESDLDEDDDETEEDDLTEDDESDSSSDEESSDESESDDEGLDIEQRLQIMQDKAKRHEDNEKAVKKGNYMLRTTAERLFDKLRNEKERYRILEHELNSLVNEMA